MSKILAVFGATGTQGGSIINTVLGDEELSRSYSIRAITRDVNSEKARLLRTKVQVVQGDISDFTSLKAALEGVHTVFAMTNPCFEPNDLEIEYEDAKRIADAAVDNGVDYIIFSSLPAVSQISGGKYTKVAHFDAKAKAEQMIRTLPIKSAFFIPGSFMENYAFLPALQPRQAADGSCGKFVGAILAEPERYLGKTFYGQTAFYSQKEIVNAISRATGKKVTYNQVSMEEFKNSMPFGSDAFAETFSFVEEYNYFGSNPEESAAWAIANARGKLTTFEEFLKANPLQLA